MGKPKPKHLNSAGIMSQETARQNLLTQLFEDLRKVLMTRYRSGYHRPVLESKRGVIETTLIFVTGFAKRDHLPHFMKVEIEAVT